MTEADIKEAEERVSNKIGGLSGMVTFFVSHFDELATRAILLNDLESLAVAARQAGYDDFAEDVKLLILNRVRGI